MELIDKAAVVAEIERRIKINKGCMLGLRNLDYYQGKVDALSDTISLLDTLEVKEVNITEMADDYYDALMKEAADQMDEGTMGHCRLAYYTGCKDVLNKLRKRE